MALQSFCETEEMESPGDEGCDGDVVGSGRSSHQERFTMSRETGNEAPIRAHDTRAKQGEGRAVQLARCVCLCERACERVCACVAPPGLRRVGPGLRRNTSTPRSLARWRGAAHAIGRSGEGNRRHVPGITSRPLQHSILPARVWRHCIHLFLIGKPLTTIKRLSRHSTSCCCLGGYKPRL